MDIGADFPDHLGENPGTESQTEWQSTELEGVFAPPEAKPLPVPLVDEYVELRVREIERGHPIAGLQRFPKGLRSLHPEPLPG